MKAPNGFGKNYFTFSSILAYNVQNIQEAQISFASSLFCKKHYSEGQDLEEEDSPPELLELNSLVIKKPCHCDCFFHLRTKIALLINLYIPRCPYYTTYFAFRRSGVHPPFYIL